MRSAMASSREDWCPAGGAARCKRSRTISDFEHPRPRDSNSIPATRGSGNRTVRVLIGTVYYGAARHARQSQPGKVAGDRCRETEETFISHANIRNIFSPASTRGVDGWAIAVHPGEAESAERAVTMRV